MENDVLIQKEAITTKNSTVGLDVTTVMTVDSHIAIRYPRHGNILIVNIVRIYQGLIEGLFTCMGQSPHLTSYVVVIKGQASWLCCGRDLVECKVRSLTLRVNTG